VSAEPSLAGDDSPQLSETGDIEPPVFSPIPMTPAPKKSMADAAGSANIFFPETDVGAMETEVLDGMNAEERKKTIQANEITTQTAQGALDLLLNKSPLTNIITRKSSLD